MRCLFAGLAVGTLAVAGCHSASPMTDPFGAARVPPPPIGVVSGPPAPYGASVPPVASVPGAPVYSAPPGSPAYGPPAGAPPGAIQGLAPPPPASAPYTAPAPLPPAANNKTSSGGWVSATGSAASGATPENSAYNKNPAVPKSPLSETASNASLAHAATETPGGNNVPGQQNLQPLTQLQQTPIANPLRDPRGATGVQPVSQQMPPDDPNRVSHSVYTREAGAAAGAAAATQYRPGSTAAGAAATPQGATAQRATYGFDGNYAWLQGQLEYSAATRVWKLRYVPIDGPTDRFGGSVVLADSDLLAGHKAGEFVTVKGRLDGRPGPQGSFAPLYRVSQVQKTSD